MIDPKAEPLYNTPPRKPIDIRYGGGRRCHPTIITREDYQNGVVPDEALYEYDWQRQHWVLK